MELYVHIPFCIKKCNYCDFLSFPGYGCGADEKHRSLLCKYVDALCREIDVIESGMKRTASLNLNPDVLTLDEESRLKTQIQKSSETVDTCFIGGGTPSVLDTEQMEKLLKSILKLTVSGTFKEFTIECNPGTLTKEKLLLYKKYGVNRLSIGLQSADNGILRRLGRIHTYGEFLDSYGLAKESGFENINIDLISAVPGQTVENWKDTLEKVIALEPRHISAYSLILEEGTPLYADYEKSPESLNLPDEDTEREIYHLTKKILKENGYERYEISNYAKSGYECRHNIGYWTGEEYIGVGLGAASYLSEQSYLGIYGALECETASLDKAIGSEDNERSMLRIKNTDDIDRYISAYLDNVEINTSIGKAGGCDDLKEVISCEVLQNDMETKSGVRDIEETLNRDAQMSEFCILGLRMCAGISKSEFKSRFGTDIYEVYENIIKEHMADGLLEEVGDRIRCTEAGLDLNNTVLCDFM